MEKEPAFGKDKLAHLLVVVEDDDHVLEVHEAGVVERFIGHAARDGSVPDHRNAVLLTVLQVPTMS